MILCTKVSRKILLIAIGLTMFGGSSLVAQPLSLVENYKEIIFLGANNMGLYEFINGVDPVNGKPTRNGDKVFTYDSSLGDCFGDVFTSYLAMYRATGDKAYLHKFISETYFVQQFRNDLHKYTSKYV